MRVASGMEVLSLLPKGRKFVLCGGVQGVEAPQARLFLGKPTGTLGFCQLRVH